MVHKSTNHCRSHHDFRIKNRQCKHSLTTLNIVIVNEASSMLMGLYLHNFRNTSDVIIRPLGILATSQLGKAVGNLKNGP